MARKTVLSVVRFLEKCLVDIGLNVDKIIVFGSQVKGTAREDSDIDIVIVSEDFRGKDIFERAKLTGKPEVLTIREFMVPLDIITMTPEELESGTSIVASYAREGKVFLPLRRQNSAKKKAAARQQRSCRRGRNERVIGHQR